MDSINKNLASLDIHDPAEVESKKRELITKIKGQLSNIENIYKWFNAFEVSKSIISLLLLKIKKHFEHFNISSDLKFCTLETIARRCVAAKCYLETNNRNESLKNIHEAFFIIDECIGKGYFSESCGNMFKLLVKYVEIEIDIKFNSSSLEKLQQNYNEFRHYNELDDKTPILLLEAYFHYVIHGNKFNLYSSSVIRNIENVSDSFTYF